MSQSVSNQPKEHTGFAALIRNRNFCLIFIIALMIYLNMFIINVSLPVYADLLGAGSQAVGFLTGMFGVCALLPRPVSGQLVDNESKILLLRVCICAIIVSTLIFAFTTAYALQVIARALYGLTWGVGSTLFMTIATGSLTQKHLAFGIGIFTIAQTSARCISPLIALPIGEMIGYANLYKCIFGLLIIALVLTFFLKIEHTPKPDKHYTVSIKNMISVPALPHAAVNLFNQSVKWSVMTFMALYAADLGVERIALYFSIQALATMVFVPFLSRLSDKLGPEKMLIPAQILELVAIMLIVFGRSLPVFLLAALLFGIGMAGEEPTLMSECVKASGNERGKATNTYYIGTDLAQLFGCYGAGILVDFFGYSQMFFIVAIPPVIYFIIYMFLRRKQAAKQLL